jgi:hypothetical protein
VNFQFYGYTVRTTTEADLALAVEWCKSLPLGAEARDLGSALDAWRSKARFWIEASPGRENFLVSERRDEISLATHSGAPKVVYGNRYPLAFFQTQTVGTGRDQVRLAFQASPVASPKKILRGITLLVPLIEKALALRGIKHIFFTSHSLTMVAFMEKLGYSLQPYLDGGADGVVMAKEISFQFPVSSFRLPSAADLDAVVEEERIRERTTRGSKV